MPDYTNAELTELCDENSSKGVEKYVLHNKSEIRAQLIGLARQPDIITAYYNEGKQYMLTAVLGVIDERGLLVLDFGPDEATTRKAIASDRLVCTTKHDGIQIRFSCENLKSARFKALPAIAAPIPDSMYRLQRREYFRVVTPKLNGPRCQVIDPETAEAYSFSVCDLSVGGVGMISPDNFPAEVGEVFKNCRLYLPEHGQVSVNIEIRNVGTHITKSGEQLPRYGARFIGLSVADNANLQRYIFHLQTMQAQ